MSRITEDTLSQLRADMMTRLSTKRFRHTVAVEEAVTRLCALYCPEDTERMRAAALLHDLTKEYSDEEQMALCARLGLEVKAEERASPKTFHARTAAALIPEIYPALDDPLILSAVRWHTTGRAGMTLHERLLYLADYIDDSRTFFTCVLLRRYFWGADPKEMDAEGRARLLRETLILSFDLTIRDLLEEGRPVALETTEARNALLLEALHQKS